MLRRIFAATAASAVMITGLVGCSAESSQEGLNGCSAPLQPGMLSDSVSLESLTDGVPKVSITGSGDIVNGQRTVLQTGKSERIITGGEIVSATLTVFDAETGEMVVPTQPRLLEAMPKEIQGEFLSFVNDGQGDSLSYTDLVMAGVLCSAPGDVLAIAATPGQALTSGYSEDAIVVVVEVGSAGSMTAQGASRAMPWGFPALTQDANGQPGIVLPPQDAPKKQQVAIGIEGDGAKLGADKQAIGNVMTVNWNDGSVTKNTWESGLINLGTESAPQVDFRAALTGVPLGSRVVILDPNDGTPLVHVVDILSAD